MDVPALRGTLVICPLSRAAELCRSRQPSHVLSLLSPAGVAGPEIRFSAGRHLTLAMHDLTEPRAGYIAPDENLMRGMLAFGSDWDGGSPMLIHCWAGISRSTAAAFIVACEKSPATPETDIASALRTASPFATPNRLMVALADTILSRGGRMVQAIARIGRGADAFEGTPFDFASNFGQPRRRG